MQLKGSLEDNILTLLVKSDQHASGLLMQLSPELFSTRNYRKIAEHAFKYIEEYGRAPNMHIRDLLEADLMRGEEGILLGKILNDIDELAPLLQPDYVLSQLAHFIRLRQMSMAVENASDALASGDIEKAEQALYSQRVGPDTGSGIWLSDTEGMLAFMDQNEEDFFPSGIDALDDRGVRPARKELFLIIGSKKIGKSWWLIQMGKQAVLHRRSVLHITLEMSERITSARYVQALFAMTRESAATIRVPVFKKDALGRCTSLDFDTRVAEQMNLAARPGLRKRLTSLKTRAPLLIKEFPTGSLTVAQLNAYLDSLARVYDFRPDLLIVDYAGIMAVDRNNIRLSIGLLMQQLRGLAVARNMAVVTAWQGNRTTDNARVVTSGMLAEDWSMAGTADTICTISRTAAEREIGLARVLVDAARNVMDKYFVMISQSYPTGQFCIDSVYMNKHVEEEAGRLQGEDDAS